MAHDGSPLQHPSVWQTGAYSRSFCKAIARELQSRARALDFDATLQWQKDCRTLSTRPTALVHEAYLRSQLGIGVCLFHMRQYSESESTLLAAVAGLRVARGDRFNRTQDGFRALGALYTTLGKPSEAALWNAKVSQ